MYLKNQTIKISQRYAITEKLKERILGLDANEISEETNKELAHQIEHKLEEQLTAYHTSMKTQAWIPNSWIKKSRVQQYASEISALERIPRAHWQSV